MYDRFKLDGRGFFFLSGLLFEDFDEIGVRNVDGGADGFYGSGGIVFDDLGQVTVACVFGFGFSLGRFLSGCFGDGDRNSGVGSDSGFVGEDDGFREIFIGSFFGNDRVAVFLLGGLNGFGFKFDKDPDLSVVDGEDLLDFVGKVCFVGASGVECFGCEGGRVVGDWTGDAVAMT